MKDTLKVGILSLIDYEYWLKILEIKFKNVFIFDVKCQIAIENKKFNIPFFDDEIEKVIALYEFEMENEGICRRKIDLFNLIHTPNAKEWRQNIVNYYNNNRLTVNIWELELNILMRKTLEDIKEAMKTETFLHSKQKIDEIKNILKNIEV